MSHKPARILKFKEDGKDFSVRIGVAWKVGEGEGERLDLDFLPLKPGAIFSFPWEDQPKDDEKAASWRK